MKALVLPSLVLGLSLALACGGGGGGGASAPQQDASTGSVSVSVAGLPSGVGGDLVLSGPNGYQQALSASQTLAGLKPGTYTLAAHRVSTGVINGVTTGHDYDPRPLTQTLTVSAGQSQAAPPVAYSIAADLVSSELVNPGVTDVWSYIAYPLPSTTYAWTLSTGTVQSSRTDLYGLKWTAPASVPASKTLDLACTVTDTYGVVQHFTQTVWVVPPFGAPPAAWYGSGAGADALANLVVGGPTGYQLDFRFRAKHAGTLSGFRKTLKWNAPLRTGYSGGTGGSLRFDLMADDGSASHQPTGSPLASVSLANPMGAGDPYPLLSFPSAPTLVAGTLYHLVVVNTDANPTANYISTNEVVTHAELVPAQPTVADLDWSVAYGGPGDWTVRRGYFPSLELRYGDGTVQGAGWTGAWNHAPQQVSGTKAVREVFTVSGGSRTVDALYVRLRRVSGSGALTLRLETAAGTLVEALSVPAANVLTSHHWVGGAFAASHVLADAAGYRVVLQAPAGTVYEAFPLQDGAAAGAGFDPRTGFADGHAEYDPGTGWVLGWTPFTSVPETDGDLQFYFRVLP